MSDALKSYYENEGNEELRMLQNSPQYTEFLTLTKYFDRLIKPSSAILDPCAGTGVYAFHLAQLGHCVTAGDLFDVNVNVIRSKQKELLKKNEISPLNEIYQGDVLDLSRFASESFDAVLCMGALYHMKNKADRQRAISECLRVLKPNGIFVATYINRYAAVIGSCQGELLDIDELIAFLENGTEGVFYTHTPVQLEEELANFKIEKLYHLGADGIGYLLHGKTPIVTYEGLLRWRKLHFETCEVRELLGYSYHGAFFGKKA